MERSPHNPDILQESQKAFDVCLSFAYRDEKGTYYRFHQEILPNSVHSLINTIHLKQYPQPGIIQALNPPHWPEIVSFYESTLHRTGITDNHKTIVLMFVKNILLPGHATVIQTSTDSGSQGSIRMSQIPDHIHRAFARHVLTQLNNDQSNSLYETLV